MGCNRRKDVTSVKNKTDGGQPVFLLIQLNKCGLPASLFRACKQACDRSVIGTHVEPTANLGSHWAARCSYPGIDDHNMDGPFWKVGNRACENIGCFTNVLRRDHMT